MTVNTYHTISYGCQSFNYIPKSVWYNTGTTNFYLLLSSFYVIGREKVMAMMDEAEALGSGTVLTCGADNNDVVIESYSVSFGVKPSFKLIDNLLINADLGIHRWDQSENDFIPNNSTTNLANYAGINIYMGIGLEFYYNNFSAEIGYLEHNMKYDAKSFTGGLKYNF